MNELMDKVSDMPEEAELPESTAVMEEPVAEEPAEEAAEAIAEEPAEEPAEEIAEEPAEEPAEEIAEEPAEEAAEEPAEEPAEEAVDEEPAEAPAEPVDEEPAPAEDDGAFETTDTPVWVPEDFESVAAAEQPEEPTAEEEPAEELTAEEAVEEIAEEPAEEAVEEIAEEPAEEAVEEFAEDPAEEPADEEPPVSLSLTTLFNPEQRRLAIQYAALDHRLSGLKAQFETVVSQILDAENEKKKEVPSRTFLAELTAHREYVLQERDNAGKLKWSRKREYSRRIKKLDKQIKTAEKTARKELRAIQKNADRRLKPLNREKAVVFEQMQAAEKELAAIVSNPDLTVPR